MKHPVAAAPVVASEEALVAAVAHLAVMVNPEEALAVAARAVASPSLAATKVAASFSPLASGMEAPSSPLVLFRVLELHPSAATAAEVVVLPMALGSPKAAAPKEALPPEA